MMHPTEETLLRYRFETSELAESKEVADHLRTCTECAARFAVLGKSVDRLSAYDVERELDPTAVVRALEQAKARAAQPVEEDPPGEDGEPESDAPPKPGFFAWLGFLPGARFHDARLAASLAFLGCAVLLGAGQTFVSLRQVETETRIVGEQNLVPGGRAYTRIQVVNPKRGAGVEDAQVAVTLVVGTRRIPLFEGKTNAAGVAEAALEIPDEEFGAAQLEVKTSARGEDDVVLQPVMVGRDFKVHLSTDKPLYQPGQTIHVRALALESPSLAPAKDREVVFEVHDPKGNRLSGKNLKASRFGVAAWDVELSNELALGDYTVSAQLGRSRADVPVKISRYTLPKFKLVLRGTKDTVLAGETLRADLSARYFFGKPVDGAAVRAVLLRGDGSLVAPEFNGVAGKDGELRLEFEVPSTVAAPGQPEALNLQVEVKDAAGQQEQKSQVFTVARELLSVEVFARHGGVSEGLPNTLYVLTTTPDGRPVPCEVTLTPSSGPDLRLRTAENGVGSAQLAPLDQEQASRFWVEAQASGPDGRRATRRVPLTRSLPDFQADTDRALYRPGEVVNVKVTGRRPLEPVVARVFQEGRVVYSQAIPATGAEAQAALTLPPTIKGSAELEISVGAATVTQRIIVAEPGGLAVTMTADENTHRPGATGKLRFEVKDQAGKPKVAALGISVVDESLWALTASKPAQARAFFLLDRALQAPQRQLSAGDLLAGKRFSDDDQAAAQLLLSLSPPAPRATTYSQGTYEVEAAKLRAQRNAWEGFAFVALQVLLCVFGLVALVATVRFASSWFAALVVGSSLFGLAVFTMDLFTMDLFTYRMREAVFPLALVAYVLAGIAHSVWRKAIAWGYVIMPLFMVGPLIFFFGDNVRRLYSLSADALAGGERSVAFSAPSGAMQRKAMRDVDIEWDGKHEEKARGLLVLGGAPEPAAPPRREVRVRQNFPETMYVRPELVTDESGVATLELPFADSITDWRLSALASSADGELGTMDTALRVFQEFFVDLDTPVALVRGDSATIPIAVHNYLATAQTIRLEVKAEDWFEVVGLGSFALKLEGNAIGGRDVRIKVLKPGRHQLTVKADGTDLSDAVVRTLLVTEAGQQKTQVVSGTLKAGETTTVAITVPPGAVRGATSLMLKVFPSPLASALDGLEGSLRAPHGCFEQTSSTTYPNVLVWNYLERTGKKNPAVQERARGFVALGYQRLLSFEVAGGGFEWFGRAPANQVLTAYGLMEFKDMARVFPVDEQLIQRTQDWLVSRQQPDGAWNPDQSSLADGLWKSGYSGRLMVSAYVTWSLVESGYQGRALAPALAFLAANLAEVNDPYTLSILAATLGKAGHPAAAATGKKLVAAAQREKDLAWYAPADATLYYSRGIGGTVESTALAAYALMVTKQEPQLVRALLGYLAANRDATGAWHSTQGTVLALRTLLLATAPPTQDHELAVRVNGADAGKLTLKSAADAPALCDLAAAVKPGLNVVEVTGPSDAQFQVVAVYTQPWREKADEGEEPLTLRVDYGRTRTEVGGIVPVDLRVTYRGADASGMVVVSLGLPAGLAALPEDLVALVDSGAVARFELAADAVNLYLDRLTTKVPQQLSLRLKAKSKVDTQGVGSLAYLYYHPAVRSVVAATGVQVN